MRSYLGEFCLPSHLEPLSMYTISLQFNSALYPSTVVWGFFFWFLTAILGIGIILKTEKQELCMEGKDHISLLIGQTPSENFVYHSEMSVLRELFKSRAGENYVFLSRLYKGFLLTFKLLCLDYHWCLISLFREI